MQRNKWLLQSTVRMIIKFALSFAIAGSVSLIANDLSFTIGYYLLARDCS